MILHREKGVNPKMCICPRCGEENNELVLLGNKDYKQTCDSCGMVHYGGVSGLNCKCGSSSFTRTQIGEFEKIPTSLCSNCKRELAEHKKEVALGGVYFKCKCGTQGVIKAGDYATSVREAAKIPTGPVGIEFSTCQICKGEFS